MLQSRAACLGAPGRQVLPGGTSSRTRIPGILRPGMLSQPRAGPQCPLLALQALPNTGNPPATSPAPQPVGSAFSDYYFVVGGTAGKNQIFQRFSPQTAVGAKPFTWVPLASVMCHAGKREYTLLIRLPETPLLPRERKNRGRITASSLLSAVEIRSPSPGKGRFALTLS